MAFCSNCGKELAAGAKFCFECGTPVGAVDETTRRTVYSGEIHKCPSCGEALKAFETVCPACGYELRGASTSNSVRDFAAKIDGAQTDTQRVNIIRNYPIPNTKEDIFEFMILASTNITGKQQKEVFDAWLVKFEQSYQKAQLVIADSSDMARIKVIYDKTHKQISKEKLFRNAKAAGDAISKSELTGKILLCIGKNAAIIVGIVLFIVAIIVDVSGGHSEMYELIGAILLIASAATLTRRGASLLEILIGALSGGLSLLLANFLENGSMLRLCGAAVLIIVAVSFFKRLAKQNDK